MILLNTSMSAGSSPYGRASRNVPPRRRLRGPDRQGSQAGRLACEQPTKFERTAKALDLTVLPTPLARRGRDVPIDTMHKSLICPFSDFAACPLNVRCWEKTRSEMLGVNTGRIGT